MLKKYAVRARYPAKPLKSRNGQFPFLPHKLRDCDLITVKEAIKVKTLLAKISSWVGIFDESLTKRAMRLKHKAAEIPKNMPFEK